MVSEDDTRVKLIDPKLHESGWTEDMIERGRHIAPGKIIDEQGTRRKGTEIDYILFYGTIPIAIVEAKKASMSAFAGMEQAKDDARNYMHVPFAYSTNGHKIEEFDFTTNKQRSLDCFPTPDELWNRYLEYKFKQGEVEPAPLTYSYHQLRGKSLRYYQKVAITRVIESIVEGKKRILLTMATGSGKTYVAFQIVWKLLKSRYFKRVLYLADRNFLKNQAYNEFAPFEDARALIEGGNAPKSRDVYFSIYQAMYAGDEGGRLFQEYPPDFFDLIIIDECHRSGYGTWKEILDYFSDAVQLGMTATPKRRDNIDTYAYFGEPVYSYSMGRGIEDGFLAPFQIFRNFTNIDKHGLIIQEAIHQGAQIYVPEEEDLKDIYTMESFEKEIVLPDRTRKICEHLANLLRTLGPLQKTIVFCVNMEHAAQVAKELQNRFADLGYSDYALRIVSESPTANEDFERFQDSEKITPVVATTVDLLTTGVDVPSVQNIVFMKPIRSKVYFKQHLGRGCRIDPIIDKFFFRVIDYVNATRLLDDWDYPSGAMPEKIVEGEFDISLEGVVIHHQTQSPVADARIVAQVAPNMQRFARTDSDGQFNLTRLPHSPTTIHITKGGFRSRQLTLTPSEEAQPIIIELKPERAASKKIRLEGIEVYIAEETKIILTADGRSLSDAEYIEYSRKGLKTQVTTLKDLRKIWIDPKRREQFLNMLKSQSISPELIASIVKVPNADAFDIIAHILFDTPILTRDERGNAFLNKMQSFLTALGKDAQKIIMTLLDKYRVGGIDQISQPEIFNVPPFDQLGYLIGVSKIFGGMDNLKAALKMLQSGLYEQVGAGVVS